MDKPVAGPRKILRAPALRRGREIIPISSRLAPIASYPSVTDDVEELEEFLSFIMANVRAYQNKREKNNNMMMMMMTRVR
ncbi:hypothetical protein CEXT_295191 [Caerostris extrusa]|uniref:Uncharacterized protein n=1 Tax=Caerostris extrusa TaxID=172846 RepID=A0AAV4RHZ9_CAEEX|nr:hypothetical protein CEXT_295191 [Caerostris extrusa]